MVAFAGARATGSRRYPISATITVQTSSPFSVLSTTRMCLLTSTSSYGLLVVPPWSNTLSVVKRPSPGR